MGVEGRGMARKWVWLCGGDGWAMWAGTTCGRSYVGEAGLCGRGGARAGRHSLGSLPPQVRGEAPHEVVLPLLQVQGVSALDVADESALLPGLHLIGACDGGWRRRGLELQLRGSLGRGTDGGRPADLT